MDWRTWFTRNVTAPQGHEARRPLNLGYALEPRMLFDGAMAATVAEAAQPDAATAEAQPPAKEVVFIDSAVPDHQQLAQGVKPGVEVVVLDAGGDALAQIADWAANHTGYDAVHIISHGAEGQVRLGNLTLTSANLASYATQLSTLGEALNPNGDLLLYGCDIAAGSGANLIASLASITGADVAASTDDTGGKGDWQLEASTGSIEAGLPLTAQAMAGYGGNLAQVTFNFESGTTGDTNWGGPFNTAATQTIGADTLKIELDQGGLVLGTENDFFGGSVLFNSLGNLIVGVDRDGAAATPTKITLTIDPGKVFDLKQFGFVEDTGNPLTLVLTTDKGSTTFPLQGINNTPGNMAETVNPSNSVLNGVTWVEITLQGGGNLFFFMDNIVLDNITTLSSDHTPTLSATAANPGFTEGGVAIDLFSGVSAATNDAGQVFNGMTLTVTNVLSGSQEWLKIDGVEIALSNGNNGSLASGGSYSISLAGSTATVTLSGLSRDNSQMGTLVDGLGYRNTSDNPGSNSRVVTITQINDNGSSSNSANPGLASSVALTPVNDAPSVTTAGGTTPFTEGTPTAIDNGLTLSDVDSTTLASATVAITGNFQSGQDLLAFTNNGSTMGNISASYNSGTGVLTLSSAGATATLAQWQAALRAVTYANSSDTPNTSTRTVSFTVNDGTDASSAATKGVSVAAANDAPQVTTTGGTTPFTEGASATAIDSSLTLSDVDSATLASATVAITGNFQSGQDLLAFTNNGSTMGNISASYNSGTGGLTLTSAGATATLAQWQAALRAVTYANSSENPNTSARTVSFTVNDGSDASSASTKIVSVTAVNDAPSVTTAGGTTPFTEGTPTAIDNGLTLSDVDSTTLASATVAITGNFQSGQDLLAFTNNGSTMGNISASYNSGTGVLTLSSAGATATLAQWQAALRAVTYANSSESPNTSARTVSFTVNDGTDASSASTKIVSVTAVNDAPQVTTAGGTTPFTEGTPAAIDSGLTLSDVDSTTLASATVAITGNFQSGQDLLAFTNNGSTMGNISASYNSGTGVLTLTSAGATATLAQWQAALRAVTYANSSENPNTSTRTVSFTVNDGTDASSAATQSVSVTAVNDAPVNNLPTNQTAPQNGQLVFSTANGNGISLSDPDATGSLQVTLTASQGTLTLATIAGLSFTLGDGSGDGSMTFTGSQADINTALNGLIFTPTSGYQGAASLQIVANDQGSSGSGGTQSDTDTLTITVAPSNTSPVTSGIANQSVSEDGVFNFTLPANTFTDNDPGDSLVLSATRADGSALPGWLSFNPATGTFSGTPTNGDVGNINIRVTATDNSNALVSSTFVLTVVNTNDAPTAGSIANQSVNEDAALSFTLPANTFADVDVGDSLTLSATLADGSALPGWLSFNPATGTFSGTPTNGDVGNINIRVTATDSSNALVSSTFVLTVVNTNDAPTAGSIANQSVTSGTPFSFSLPSGSFSDVDTGDRLTLSATQADGSALPGWLSFNPATGTFSGTPVNGDIGSISIRINVTDLNNASISSTFTLTVVQSGQAQGDPEFRVTDGNHKINSSPLSTQPLTTQLSLQPDALLPSESLLTNSADSTSVNFAAGTLSHASALANVFGTNRDGSHGSGQTALNWTGGESNSMSTYWPSSLSEHRQLELFSGGSWSQVLGTGAASPTLTQQLTTLQETELSQATALAQALQGR
ncbi:putative Ig domain-containing protein [Aeromonas veronii]